MTNFFDFRAQLHRKKERAPTTTTTTGDSASSREAMSVSDFTQLIDGAIKSGVPGSLLVRGEMSNVKRHGSSGHIYFTLKDAQACVDCVMWRSDAERLKFEPGDGEEVLVTGSVSVYAQRGRYQLCAKKIEPFGKGALEAAFRKLCAKLAAEGLFERERKKPIPTFPTRITIITSKQTAALQDMLKVLTRFPHLNISVFYVPVQGAGAAAQIGSAIEAMTRRHEALLKSSSALTTKTELILLGRGGGSGEDLWAFNEEVVARAMARCPIPIVTGIGHEIDTSIADLIADYHAHTPTEAAQVVTSGWRNARETLALREVRLGRAALAMLESARHRLAMIERHEIVRRPTERIHRLEQRLDDLAKRSQLSIGRRLNAARRRVDVAAKGVEKLEASKLTAAYRARLSELDRKLEHAWALRGRRLAERLTQLDARLSAVAPSRAIKIARKDADVLNEKLSIALRNLTARSAARLKGTEGQLQALSPLAVLDRGYSITTIKRGGAIVRSASEIRSGDAIETRVADGSFTSTVDDQKQGKLFG